MNDGPISLVSWGEGLCVSEWCLLTDEPVYSYIPPVGLSWHNAPRGDADLDGGFDWDDVVYTAEVVYNFVDLTAPCDADNDGFITWDDCTELAEEYYFG